MNKVKTLTIASLIIASAGSQASLIDFTNPYAWQEGRVSTSVTNTYGALEITVDSSSGSYYSGERCGISYISCENDGLGIRDDEISFYDGNMYDGELLTVSFNEAVDLEWIGFLDMFVESGGAESAQLLATYEDGSQAGAAWEATETQTDNKWGWLMADLDNDLDVDSTFSLDGITKLEFFTGTQFYSSSPNSDFAVAALKLANVSEPATFGLLGFGVLALWGARRRAVKA